MSLNVIGKINNISPTSVSPVFFIQQCESKKQKSLQTVDLQAVGDMRHQCSAINRDGIGDR